MPGQNSFKTPKDLKGHKVGTMRYGYVQRYWLHEHGITGNNVKIYITPQEAVQALKNGEIDVFVINYTICRYQAAINKASQMIAYLVQPMDVAYIMRKQDKMLQESLNQVLLSMWNDHSLYDIKVKYLIPIGIRPKENYKAST